METELDGYIGRGLRHGNLVQYLSMHHTLSDNKIIVEVRGRREGGVNGFFKVKFQNSSFYLTNQVIGE